MRMILSICILSVTLAGTAAADLVQKDVSRLKLRAQACVRGEVVTLADVLTFNQADPRLLEAIGGESVATGLRGTTQTQITHDQVERRLKDLGVNMARVLVSGALSCRVTVDGVGKARPTVAGGEDAPLMRERQLPGPADAMTLEELLIAKIEDGLNSSSGTVEVEFERAGREFLDLTTPPFEFLIRGSHGQKLGLREFSVTILRDGRRQRTVRIGGQVKLVKQVLVAAKPLNIGAYIKNNSLEYATRIFTSGADLGIDHAEQVIGQRVKHFVPVGEMVRIGDLKAVDLVKRSQPVTVVGSVVDGNSVSIRVTGDALDSGGYGDTIRVRLGDSRENYREVRGVVSGVGMVRLSDGGL